MASPPFGNSDARLSFNSFSALSARTPPNPPSRLAGFQFKIIGQEPELLKRISTPNPDMQYDYDSGPLSPSSLLSDQSVQTPRLPESDSAKRPSLQDRLSLLESPVTEKENIDVTMANPFELGPAFDPSSTQSIDVLSMSTFTTQAHKPHTDSSSSAGARTPFLQNLTLGKEPVLSQDMIHTAMQEQPIRTAAEQGTASTSSESRFPIISSSFETPPLARISSQAAGTSGVSTPFPSRDGVHSLTALRTLQSRLLSSLSNFNPISTANAIAAAQSAKDKCTEILATAHRSHTLAQQASLLAQDSMAATQECLTVAPTIQNRADLALSAVEKICSGQEKGSGGEWEYNATVNTFKDNLNELAEWIRQRDAYESNYLRQLEEDKIEKRKKNLALQLECESNKLSADKQSHNLNTHSVSPGMQTSIHEAGVMTVEDEADAATRAWNQHREQSAERKELAEDEFRKRREAEAEHERQRLQAQSELDAREAELEKGRAERLRAEEEERSRQEKEALELQRQQQELEHAQLLRSQKRAHNLAKFAAEEKRKVQAAEEEKEARFNVELEQKRREIHEQELLKCQEMEKAKALLAESVARSRDKVILERMKRLAVEAQQPPVSADTVAHILDKAKEKQSMTTDNHTRPSQHALLLSPPTHQASAPSSPNHAEFGNVVSKETLLTNSPLISKQQNKAFFSSIKLDESSNTINLTSLISSIPKTSDFTQAAKAPELTISIPTSIDKLLSDNSTSKVSSSHIHEVDHQSAVGVYIPLKSRLSSSPLIPLKEENLSPPLLISPVHIPNSPTTSMNNFEDIHADLNIRFDGPDAGNLSVVPPSQVLSVPPQVHRANLRPLMDANGMPYVDEKKLFSSSADQPSAAEKSRRKPLSSSQMNGDQICRPSSGNKPGSKMSNLEPLNDIPILSMPSLPASTIVAPTQPSKPKPKLPDFKRNKTVPSMTTLETSLSSKELSASAQTMPSSGSSSQSPPGSAVTQSDGSSLANLLIVSKEKVRPAAVRRNVPPLASNEQTTVLADTMDQAFQASEVHLSVSPRMGPDAAVTDGWAKSVTVADDPMAKMPQKQPPLKGVNRLSPSRRVPSVQSRPRVPRPRVNDHYSPPRRIPDPLPFSNNDYSRDSQRSGSVEYTPGYSPSSKFNEDRRSLSPENISITGRKRYRDDDSVDGPPARRYRYDSPPFRQDDPGQPSASSYHGRPPSPEPRPTSLAYRIQSEEIPWNSRGGSSYRPVYNDSNLYAYDPQSRNKKNHRYSAPHSQPIVPQGSSHHIDSSVQSNQQRQFCNDNTTDTHLPLLSRFSDSTEQTLPSFNNHHTSSRPRGPRGGGNQTLEHRISHPKPSLINRM